MGSSGRGGIGAIGTGAGGPWRTAMPEAPPPGSATGAGAGVGGMAATGGPGAGAGAEPTQELGMAPITVIGPGGITSVGVGGRAPCAQKVVAMPPGRVEGMRAAPSAPCAIADIVRSRARVARARPRCRRRARAPSVAAMAPTPRVIRSLSRTYAISDGRVRRDDHHRPHGRDDALHLRHGRIRPTTAPIPNPGHSRRRSSRPAGP